MKQLFGPGIAAMRLCTNAVKLPLLGFLFTVPFLIVAFYLWEELPGRILTWALGAVVVAVYFMFSWLIQSNTGWAAFHAVMARVSRGELMVMNDMKLGGHFDHLAQRLSEMNSSLSGIVAQVRRSADAIASAAREIASGNGNLSQRTEQQASTLEETASGMEELASTARQTADSCRKVSELSAGANATAGRGVVAMRDASATMARIDTSSKKVSEIVGVIEGIAFQTNILALNAAVEAARAGDQGRGFAVVASEVRSLAQRSAQSAKEIKALIRDSLGSVAEGNRLMEMTRSIIEDVARSTQQVSELMSEVAMATSEQTSGVGEINKAITQMESATQQNAALVEEAAASALSLEEESMRLTEAVHRFIIDDRVQDAQVVTSRTASAASPETPTVRARAYRGGGPVLNLLERREQ